MPWQPKRQKPKRGICFDFYLICDILSNMFTKCLFPIYKTHFNALWKTVEPSKFLCATEVLAAPNLELARYRARKGTRARKLAICRANKLRKANKPPEIPKYLQKKIKVSPEFNRIRCLDENWLESQPIDNVWNMKLYRGKPYSVSEAIKILQDLHVPSLLNDPSALFHVTAELDLKTKKKSKFVDDFTGIVTFPHEFEGLKKNRVVAICKDSEDQLKAANAGALFTGSTTLIKQIISGTLKSDDFDYVICHPDMFKELNALRGILKKKFPSAYNGQLRLDIDRAVTSFIKGVEYSLKRSAVEIDFGWVDVCCGRLDMPINQIEENIKHALSVIEKHKPMGVEHLFIVRTLLWCEKSRERLKIPHWEYLPNYPKNGILLSVESDDEDEPVTAAS